MTISRATKARISLAVIAAAALVTTSYSAPAVHAATIVGWTFEHYTTAATTTAASISGIAPETNPGSITAAASGVHALATSQYSDPTGNGSARSLSANGWTGAIESDYFEFDLDTTGVTGLQLSYDQISSSTGPTAFKVEYGTAGPTGPFTDLPLSAYTVATSPSWSSSTSSASFSHTFDLSTISGLTGIRIVDTVAATGTGGTDRVDNVIFSGTPAPEPATAGLLATGAAFILGRRRR